jgi:hypothetical protein
MSITPAALLTAVSGDLDNANVALTPGGVEQQEAEGQRLLCSSNSMLPKRIEGTTREALARIGFKFGSDIDNLFVAVIMPGGWKLQPTKHAMLNNLLDDKGRVRGVVFYKSAFYDRRADLTMLTRYRIASTDDDLNDKAFRVVCTDAGKLIKDFGSYTPYDFRCNDLFREAEAWLTQTYPAWRDPLAYWDRTGQ